jgi:hypothetical protein
MLEKHLAQLFEELKLGNVPAFDKDGIATIVIATFPMQVLKLDGEAYFSALIAPLPTKDKEDFLLKLMKANFLGQGTGGAVLGLKEDESCLTLSLSLPYEINYRAFKDAIEEFVNYIDYWKTETARHET